MPGRAGRAPIGPPGRGPRGPPPSGRSPATPGTGVKSGSISRPRPRPRGPPPPAGRRRSRPNSSPRCSRRGPRRRSRSNWPLASNSSASRYRSTDSRRGRVPPRPRGADSTTTSGASSSCGTSVGASPASCSAAYWPSSASFSDLPTHSPCERSNSWPLQRSPGSAAHKRKTTELHSTDSRQALLGNLLRKFGPAELRAAASQHSPKVKQTRGYRSSLTEILSAVPTRFELAISSLTGTHVGPLHHGTEATATDCIGSSQARPAAFSTACNASTSACWRNASVRSPRVFSSIPRVLSVVRRNPPVSASG